MCVVRGGSPADPHNTLEVYITRQAMCLATALLCCQDWPQVMGHFETVTSQDNWVC